MKAALFALLAAASVPALAQHQNHADMVAPQSAMILPGYGDGGFPIITSNAQAQAFFDNGMQLAHAFAHDAAVTAMKEAERLDPSCAMCAWGEAWAGGPTINFGKNKKELKPLIKSAKRAVKLARANGNPTEIALIDALVVRYRNGGGHEQGDMAFAVAMDSLARANPANDEFATIAADAWLQAPAEGDAAEKTNLLRSLALLEPVLARRPNYTPAIHFYIHATEQYGEGPRAEPYANRLAALAPNSSHLVHMPSHTFYWVGRYQEAADVNRRAVEIGIAQARAMHVPPPEGVWGLPYHGHNVVFGLGGALMAGDKDTALWLARPLVERAAAQDKSPPYSQALGGGGYVAMALFAEPSEMLSLAAPKLPYLLGMWHYARGEAYARTGDIAALEREMNAIAVPDAKRGAEDFSWQASQTLKIAQKVLDGRAKMLRGQFGAAVTAFATGAALQEEEDFTEAADPPLWRSPVRRELALAKFAAGDLAGARVEAQATMKVRPKDPGALALLAKLDAKSAAR
ncbi:MAG: hypothetical protein ABIQ32_06175 [Sphingomicrobium sp.]